MRRLEEPRIELFVVAQAVVRKEEKGVQVLQAFGQRLQDRKKIGIRLYRFILVEGALISQCVALICRFKIVDLSNTLY